ncbi:MAG: hypothetical protein WCV00_20250 [Verrucomicrobiia bacterium]
MNFEAAIVFGIHTTTIGVCASIRGFPDFAIREFLTPVRPFQPVCGNGGPPLRFLGELSRSDLSLFSSRWRRSGFAFCGTRFHCRTEVRACDLDADFVTGGVMVEAVSDEQIFARLAVGTEKRVEDVDVVEVVAGGDVLLDELVGFPLLLELGGAHRSRVDGHECNARVGQRGADLGDERLEIGGDLPALMSLEPAPSTISRGLQGMMIRFA